MKLPPGYVPGSGVHKATAFGGIGEKLMQEMGWEKGQGLGKDKKGMKKAIEVKLKDDTVGVGGSFNILSMYLESNERSLSCSRG